MYGQIGDLGTATYILSKYLTNVLKPLTETVVTSSTTEEYWYHHCRQMWTVVQVYADVLTKMHQ